MPKTNTVTRPKGPRYRTVQTPDQFANGVARRLSRVEHGGDPVAALVAVRNSWRALDPIETARNTRPGDGRFAHALGRAATLNDVPSKAERKLLTFPLDSYRRALTLDRADQVLQTSQDMHGEVLGELRAVADVDLARSVGKGRDFDPGVSLDALTARSMLLHIEARAAAEAKLTPDRRRALKAIQKAQLGHLIFDSVDVLKAMHGNFEVAKGQKGDASDMRGRIIETMYFTYRLLSSYQKTGSLEDSYPRRAVYREDLIMISKPGEPRRSFDVAVVTPASAQPTQLVQVKATGLATTYAPEIDAWRPQRRVTDERMSEVTGWFGTVVDNEASESQIQGAWRNLQQTFGAQAFAPPQN